MDQSLLGCKGQYWDKFKLLLFNCFLSDIHHLCYRNVGLSLLQLLISIERGSLTKNWLSYHKFSCEKEWSSHTLPELSHDLESILHWLHNHVQTRKYTCLVCIHRWKLISHRIYHRWIETLQFKRGKSESNDEWILDPRFVRTSMLPDRCYWKYRC